MRCPKSHDHQPCRWLALPPWGIPHAEPIGSSNNPPLAVVALPPQMWQLFLSLPCVNGRKFASKLARLAVTEGLFYYVLPRVQSLSRFATAPFTQGSLRCGGNCAKLKLFGTISTAGGFRLIKMLSLFKHIPRVSYNRDNSFLSEKY